MIQWSWKPKGPPRSAWQLRKGPRRCQRTLVIVVAWADSVEAYRAAGRKVGPEVAPDCPRCNVLMTFWSGYERDLRLEFDPDAADTRRHVRIWVRRVHCRQCGITPGLLPAFCLSRRLDEAEVIGVAIVLVVAGRPVAAVAALLAVPRSTVRGWAKAFFEAAVAIAALFASLAIAQGGAAFDLPAHPARAAVEAIGRAFDAAQRRRSGNLLGIWRFSSVVSGGALIATNRGPP